jgi:PST family polysaccharide transporter
MMPSRSSTAVREGVQTLAVPGEGRPADDADAPREPAEGAAKAPPVGRAFARGALWTVTCSLLSKGVTVVGQLALAWFLLPEDFGLVALALSITALAALFSAASLQNVLIQRQDRFTELAGQVFWLGTGLHLVAGLLIAALAPVAGWVSGDPRVVPLVLLAALSFPLAALTYPYTAKLYVGLRFRTVTLLQAGGGVVQTAAAIALAACGFGPYSVILPQLAVQVYCAVVYRAAAGAVPLWPIRPSLWPALIAPSVWLMLQSVFMGLRVHGMTLVIALFHDARLMGLFFWGLQLSTQIVFWLSVSLQQVLFPALAKLNEEPERQANALRRAERVLLVVCVPLCVLQMVLSAPLIPLVFGAKWQAAVPVVFWLTGGIFTLPLGLLGWSLLMARGRNRLLAGVAFLQASCLAAASLVGARLGDEVAIARTVGVCSFGVNLLPYYAACALTGAPRRQLLEPLLRVALLAGSFGLVAVGLDRALAGLPVLPRCAAVGAAVLALCGLLLLRNGSVRGLLARAAP